MREMCVDIIQPTWFKQFDGLWRICRFHCSKSFIVKNNWCCRGWNLITSNIKFIKEKPSRFQNTHWRRKTKSQLNYVQALRFILGKMLGISWYFTKRIYFIKLVFHWKLWQIWKFSLSRFWKRSWVTKIYWNHT